MKQRKRDVANEKPRYQPTEQEQSALRRQVERLKAATPAPRLKVSSDSKAEVISLDHPDIMVGSRLLAEALGCKRRSNNPSLKRPGNPVAPE